MNSLPTTPRGFLQAAAGLALLIGGLGGHCSASPEASVEDLRPPRPNIVIIFTDDQGYGDLGCYGAEDFATPRLDQLAAEGTRFTSCYAQVVCGPSRSALLTGRYPIRSQGWSMPASEVTLAELLQGVGYRTACIGKWDVSNRAPVEDRVPNAQGFDTFWGTLGANDNGRVTLYDDREALGVEDDMAALTRRYTDKAIEFIDEAKDGPFFLYLAHTMVHSVIESSPEFTGGSKRGLYGDVMEELDHHCGRLLDKLDQLELRDDTLVIFASDNGSWGNMSGRLRELHGGRVAWGTPGPLRGEKGSTYEGGSRVPCLVRWPGHVPAGRESDAILSTLDLLPTFARLAGYSVPADRLIDGVDQTDLWVGRSELGARNDFYYFARGELHAVRRGRWKLLLADRKLHYGYVKDKGSREVELYDLDADLGERRNLAADQPERVAELLAHARALPQPAEPYYPGIYLPKRKRP